jgi:hypothetical protein
MAEIQIAIVFDGEDNDDELTAIIDKIAEACPPGADFGLQVDGEHRDPDSPADSLF